MKRISDQEKSIIQHILSIRTYGFYIDDILKFTFPERPYMEIRAVRSQNEIHQPSNNVDNVNFRFLVSREDGINHEEIKSKLFIINSLITYLVSQKYLEIINNRTFEVLEINHDHLQGKPTWQMHDITRFDLFKKLFNHYHPTEELKELAKNNYRTRSEQTANWSLGVSIVAFLLTGFSTYYTFKNSNDFKQLKEDVQTRADTLEKKKITDTIKLKLPAKKIDTASKY